MSTSAPNGQAAAPFRPEEITALIADLVSACSTLAAATATLAARGGKKTAPMAADLVELSRGMWDWLVRLRPELAVPTDSPPVQE